jgi:hypothetical protein
MAPLANQRFAGLWQKNRLSLKTEESAASQSCAAFKKLASQSFQTGS